MILFWNTFNKTLIFVVETEYATSKNDNNCQRPPLPPRFDKTLAPPKSRKILVVVSTSQNILKILLTFPKISAPP